MIAMVDYPALLEFLKTRRSVRAFEPRPLPRDLIRNLVEAARWAPSNENRQAWKFIVLEDRRLIHDLSRLAHDAVLRRMRTASGVIAEQAQAMLYHATFFAQAPCVILVMHKRPAAIASKMLQDVKNPALVSGEILSAAMAVQNILLAANALGLGACVMTAPLAAPEAMRAIPDLPPSFEPTCLLAIGYPAEQPPPPTRKPLEHVIEYR
jgi:nitroreductase